MKKIFTFFLFAVLPNAAVFAQEPVVKKHHVSKDAIVVDSSEIKYSNF